MKHLGVCLQRLPREKHFYRQQASSAGGGGGGGCPHGPPLAALCPPAGCTPALLVLHYPSSARPRPCPPSVPGGRGRRSLGTPQLTRLGIPCRVVEGHWHHGVLTGAGECQ